MMNRKVDFLIIGTQKAGTTSLFQYILQHPDIYFSEVKEVNYFVYDQLYAKGEKYYHSFFSKLRKQKIIGSSYVHMLPCVKCVDRVYHYNPDIKIVVMLRNPADRAISAYKYAVRNGWEDADNSLQDAIKLEPKRLSREEYDLTYCYNGLYHKHLASWMKRFAKENILVLKQEELQSSPQETMNRLFDFLQVGHRSIDTTKKYNVASGVHNQRLQKIMLDKGNPLARFLGSLMPQRAKVFIRAKIFPFIYRVNTSKEKEIKVTLTEKDKAALKKYFVEDLASLAEEFNIRY
jgi:hypothetical protein